MTFEELLNKLAEDYLNPPDGKKAADRNGHTRLADLQTRYNLSSLKIQKLLVTAGVFEPVKRSSSFYAVKRLHEAGKTVDEIMADTGLSKAAVDALLPYERGAKNLDKLGVEITGGAARQRKHRSSEEMKKENARALLMNNLSDEALWKALDEHDSVCFKTASGQRFEITVPENDAEKPELAVTILNGGVIHIPQRVVLDAYHNALVEKAEKNADVEEKDYDEFLRPVFIYLGVLDGDRNEVTTKRNVIEACSCCGRIGAPLFKVSSFADLVTLKEQFKMEDRAAWTEEQRRYAEATEKHLAKERDRYNQKVEAAKESKVVHAFDDEGDRYLCKFCAETIYHVLVEGDMPYVGTKINYRRFPIELARRLCNDQLISTSDRWADKYGAEEGDIFEAVDTAGAKHYFKLSFREMGALLSFDAQEVHRLTKAGKRAINNTDTDYEYHHLIELAEGENKEQRKYAGLLELMDKITDGLRNPTLERGQLRTTGTIIPVYIDEGEYGFMIDGKVYSGDELARMASSTEGWQMQFQIKDPTEDVLRQNEYLMPVRLGKKELMDDTLELLRLFTEDGEFISDHDEENFTHLFKGVLEKLKLYNDSNPRGFGKLAGMGIIKVLGWYEGTEWCQEQVREIIR